MTREVISVAVALASAYILGWCGRGAHEKRLAETAYIVSPPEPGYTTPRNSDEEPLRCPCTVIYRTCYCRREHAT